MNHDHFEAKYMQNLLIKNLQKMKTLRPDHDYLSLVKLIIINIYLEYL